MAKAVGIDLGTTNSAVAATMEGGRAEIIPNAEGGRRRSQQLLDGVTTSGQIRDPVRDQVMGEVRSRFRPEFLNRVDDIVMFKPLTLPEIEQIVDLLIADVRQRLADRRLTLELTEPGRALIARAGYDPVYGARPLRRFISNEAETRIGRALLSGELHDGATIILDAQDGELIVRWDNQAPPERTEAELAGAPR